MCVCVWREQVRRRRLVSDEKRMEEKTGQSGSARARERECVATEKCATAAGRLCSERLKKKVIAERGEEEEEQETGERARATKRRRRRRRRRETRW